MNDAEDRDPGSEAAVDALIVEFGGDPRAAIRALLHDVDVLARDFCTSVSRGYVRHPRTIVLRAVGTAKAEPGENSR